MRNLTGDPEKQYLVESFTDRLVADLFRHCRGLSLVWAANERRSSETLVLPNPSALEYVLYGSVQQGGPEMLRINMRISNGRTTDYL